MANLIREFVYCGGCKSENEGSLYLFLTSHLPPPISHFSIERLANMETNSLRVFLIEDNPGDADIIKEMLCEVDELIIQLESSDRLLKSLERLVEGNIDVILSDLSLPDSQGLDTLRRLLESVPDIPIVVMTGLDDARAGIEAVHRGAQDYLVKGQVDSNLLARSLRYAVERHRKQKKLDAFINAVSYDIKNPLINIRSYLEMLGEKPELLGKYRNSVIKQVDQLINKIDEMIG